LGAARNFGVERCSGEYIAFLDTDDVYHDFALEKLYKMVSENHYALAYGGHSNMNSSGNYIGVFQPDKREGYLFPELLVNFNIPIVGSIVSKKILIDSELTFDPQISASEEYCLFMQLAANYHIVSTDTLLLKYRVHDDSLTNRTIAKWGEERRYTLSKILASKPELKGRYPSQFNAAYARAAYYDAQYKMHLKEPKQAQLLLSEYKFFNITYFLLYLVSYMPPLVWNLIQRWKYKRVNFS
jgi:glycosyltransferase involved in cell wall biosynthesis